MAEVEMKFAWIPPGWFLMGAQSDQKDEQPVHKVTLSKGFYMGVVPVTQAQWEWVMGSGNRPSNFKGEDRPVENVRWTDCDLFCTKMKELVNKPIRLPTEAEWEYACRAGTTTDYYSGNGELALGEVGWYKGNSGEQTKPVGQLPANRWRLHDMHGNVWEWCQDDRRTYSNQDIKDPVGALNSDSRVLRGGAWNYHPEYCRAAYRSRHALASRYSDYGFRVCFRLD